MTPAAKASARCRGADADDYAAARGLVSARVAEPYAGRLLELLDAVADGSPEYRAIVALEAGAAVEGVGIYGLVAGANAAGAIYAAVATSTETAQMLVGAMMRALEKLGARFATAELAEDVTFDDQRSALLAHGFRDEARVPDLYRDGVALTLLRCDFQATA